MHEGMWGSEARRAFFGSKAIAQVWHRRPDAIPVSHATRRHELHTWEDTKCRKTWAYILILYNAAPMKANHRKPV